MPGTRPGERARLQRREHVAGEDAAGDLGAARVVDHRQPCRRRSSAGTTATGRCSTARRWSRARAATRGRVRRPARRRGASALESPSARFPAPTTRCRSTTDHRRSGPGWSGTPSKSTSVAPMLSAPQMAHGPHHPADVGEPEQAVVLADVEAVRHVLRRLDGEAAVDVHGALRPAGRPARVDDHERRVGVGVGDGRPCARTRPASPRSSTSRPGCIGDARVAELGHHQDVLERRQLRRGLVGDRLHRDGARRAA